MSNEGYKIYKNIMSVNPIIDKGYLGRILNLPESQIIRSIEVTEVIESNTALLLSTFSGACFYYINFMDYTEEVLQRRL